MKMESALVVFSGGQDSTTCLFWAKENFKRVEAVSFNYKQKHVAEIACASGIASKAGVQHTIIDASVLNNLTANALTRSDMIPAAGASGSLPNTFVDGRNMYFLLLTAIMAKQLGIKHIVTGVCETDFSGYPDCRDVFIKSLNVTLNLAMNYDFVIHTPLMWLNKMETWKLADDLGVLDLICRETVTCYNGIIGDGCGTCPSCLLRKRGLEEYLQWKKEMKLAPVWK